MSERVISPRPIKQRVHRKANFAPSWQRVAKLSLLLKLKKSLKESLTHPTNSLEVIDVKNIRNITGNVCVGTLQLHLFGPDMFVLANYVPVLFISLHIFMVVTIVYRLFLGAAFFPRLCFEITFKSWHSIALCKLTVVCRNKMVIYCWHFRWFYNLVFIGKEICNSNFEHMVFGSTKSLPWGKVSDGELFAQWVELSVFMSLALLSISLFKIVAPVASANIILIIY